MLSEKDSVAREISIVPRELMYDSYIECAEEEADVWSVFREQEWVADFAERALAERFRDSAVRPEGVTERGGALRAFPRSFIRGGSVDLEALSREAEDWSHCPPDFHLGEECHCECEVAVRLLVAEVKRLRTELAAREDASEKGRTA